jgi:hypothetical protein
MGQEVTPGSPAAAASVPVDEIFRLQDIAAVKRNEQRFLR